MVDADAHVVFAVDDGHAAVPDVVSTVNGVVLHQILARTDAPCENAGVLQEGRIASEGQLLHDDVPHVGEG